MLTVSAPLLAPSADGFYLEVGYSEAGCRELLPRVVSAVNEALSGGLENVRALGFIMPAARASPDGQETAPRGDKEA